jgi:hypothetical protein
MDSNEYLQTRQSAERSIKRQEAHIEHLRHLINSPYADAIHRSEAPRLLAMAVKSLHQFRIGFGYLLP